MKFSVGFLLVCCVPAVAQAPAINNLREPSSFSTIADTGARSRLLFSEAAKVITSPRCINCHPSGDHPTQANDMLRLDAYPNEP